MTEWEGRSPTLVEDQLTYPIVTKLVAAPKVRVVRGYSFFGYSFVYVVFEDGTDLYWARSHVLEYLNYVSGRLPKGVTPSLGPDATGVGWVFQYALVDTTGKHDLAELRSLQDWYLRYYLKAVPGVAEVAPLGGFVRQYQVNVDPNRLQAYGLSIGNVVNAVRGGNIDANFAYAERLLPRGTLREPPSHLARASTIFITKSDGNTAELRQRIAQLNPSAGIIECIHHPLYLEDVFSGQRLGLAGQVVAMVEVGGADQGRAFPGVEEHRPAVGRMRQEGRITEEEARSSRFRNIITRSVGFEEDVLVDIIAVDVEEGDLVVLCCDGLSNLVTDAEILEIAKGSPLDEAPEQLVALANERGGDDNITVVVVKVGGERRG